MKRHGGGAGATSSEVRFEPPDFFDALTRHGRGECNIAGVDGEMLQFRIGPNGEMAGSLMQSALVVAKVSGLLVNQPSCGVTLITETEERVIVRDERNRKRAAMVPLKEARGYRVTRQRGDAEVVLWWEGLPREAVMEMYREGIGVEGVTAMLRDHRFVDA